MACTACDELNFSENPISDFNCDTPSNGLCNPTDQMWVRNCDENYGAYFEAKTCPDGVVLQVVDTIVCLTRTRQRYITLQLCDSSDSTQKWKPISATQEFELIPAYFHPNDDQDFCVTQQHHPKDFELMGLKVCPEAEKWATSEWEIYLDE